MFDIVDCLEKKRDILSNKKFLDENEMKCIRSATRGERYEILSIGAV